MAEYSDLTILVVDDEELLRDSIAFDFRRQKFKTLLAESGTEALGIIRQQKIDLIISDLRMPDGDGVMLLENIVAMEVDQPPVILSTGFSEISEKELLAKGAKGLLVKPFDRKELKALALSVLSPPR